MAAAIGQADNRFIARGQSERRLHRAQCWSERLRQVRFWRRAAVVSATNGLLAHSQFRSGEPKAEISVTRRRTSKRRQPDRMRAKARARSTTPPQRGRPKKATVELESLLDLYLATGDVEILDLAVECSREALMLEELSTEANSDSAPTLRAVLGMCLFHQHLVFGQQFDLDEAAAHLRAAIADDAQCAGLSLAYVRALALQFEADPTVVRRDALLSEAWALTTPDDLLLASGITCDGEVHASILLLETEAAYPSADGPGRPQLIHCLSWANRARASATGNRAYLDRAIDWSESVRSEPERDLLYAWTELERAASLAERYEASGDMADLNLAIDACERGIQATLSGELDPTEANLGYQWFELGLCRRMRGERTKRADDFQEALHAYKAGFDLVGQDDAHGHVGYMALLQTDWAADVLADSDTDLESVLGPKWRDDQSDFGLILRWNVVRQRTRKHMNDGRPSDARVSLTELEDLAEGMTHRPARRLELLTDVGGNWHCLFEISENDDDRVRAIEVTERVLARADLLEPHEVANLWRVIGYLRAVADDLPGALEAYELGLVSMRQAVRLPSSRADQEHLFEGLSGLVSDVVVGNALNDNHERANELAWNSMGLLYREATRRQALILLAAEKNPALGNELRELYRAAALQWTTLDTGHGAHDSTQIFNARRLGASRIDAVTTPLVDLLPDVDEDWSSDESGIEHSGDISEPIKVVLCVSHMGVEAFVFMDEPFQCSFGDRRPDLDNVLDDYAMVVDGDVQGDQREQLLDDILVWLGKSIFQPIVSWIRDRRTSARPRVQFCLSGRLGALPIAGAWVTIADGNTDRTVRLSDALNFSIVPSPSSYAPRRSPLDRDALKPSLIAAAWNVPGRSMLKESRAEAQAVTAALGAGPHDVLGLDESQPATYQAVVSGLQEARLFHFSGHAEVDYQHPDLSFLVLEDSAQAHLTAGTVAELDLGSGRLAFLAACAAGHTRGRLRDDPFDLAAAFLYAGFEHVVAPLRPIPDPLARSATAYFYNALLGDGSDRDSSPGPIDVKSAYDLMVSSLRHEYPHDLMAWAGFVLLEAPQNQLRAAGD